MSSITRIKSGVAIAPLFLAMCCAEGWSAELTVGGAITTSLIQQNVSSQDGAISGGNRQTGRIAPTVFLGYRSKKLRLDTSATHTQQYTKRDNADDFNNDFTELDYNASYTLAENALFLFATGGQRYRAVSQDAALTSSFLLDTQNQTKTTSHQGGLRLNAVKGDYYAATGNISQFVTTSSRTFSPDGTVSDDDIDTSGTVGRLTISNGDNFHNAYWNATASYRSTERDIQGDFESTQAAFEWGYNVFGDFGVIAEIEYDNNEADEGNITLPRGRQFGRFTTYGAGLQYRPSKLRYISILSKKVSTDGENDGETFTSLNLGWRFSSRTSIQFSHDKRYFGDANTFNFNYGTRVVKASVGYSERTTTFSLLQLERQSVGSFVCPADNIGFDSCFQPQDSDYELQPGEIPIDLFQVVAEINEQVILRKQLNANIGFQKRRVALSLNGSIAKTDYLGTELNNESNNVSLNGSLKLSSRTSLFSNIRYSETSYERINGQRDTESWVATFGLTRKLGRQLTVGGDFRFLDRTLTSESGDEDDLQERRLSLRMTYYFSSKR